MFSVFSTIGLWAVAIANLASAAPLASTEQACKDIEAAIVGKLFYPHERLYALENTDYYNIGLAELMPACIVLPTTAQEVSEIVKILNNYADVPFAVKSGGHDPNKGHSSVKDGVLIALSKMIGATYDKAKDVIRFKPGGHWSDVIGTLDKQGVRVVGGRLGEVGVGGLVMQGGLSFLSTQLGLAADNILEYEMVLANGTIAKINSQERKELVTAMRGGGDQFGIATEFTSKAHKTGQVWGGLRFFLGNSRYPLYEGLHEFTRNQTDPKAAVIFTNMQPFGLFNLYLVFFFYDGPNPPKGAWGKLGDVKPAVDLCKQRTYPDMLDAANFGAAAGDASASLGSLFGSLGPSGLSSLGKSGSPASASGGIPSPAAPKGSGVKRAAGFQGAEHSKNVVSEDKDKDAIAILTERYISAIAAYPPPSTVTIPPRELSLGARTSFRSLTLPLLDREWFSEIESVWGVMTQTFTYNHPSALGTIAFQPLSNLIGKQSEAAGGNAMGLTGTDPPRFVIEIAWQWRNKSLDAEVEALSKSFGDALEARSKMMLAQSPNSGAYFPLFMNDANGDQNPFESYKDKDKFAQLQKSVDPSGFFRRTGSFKYR